MPFYLITVCLKEERRATPTGKRNEELRKGIRQWKSADLDKVYQICVAKCRQKWGERMLHFDCVMISRHSEAYHTYVRGRERRKDDRDDMGMYKMRAIT